MKKIIFILFFSLSLLAQREKEISVTIEKDSSKPLKNIPVKFLIKNISNEDLDTSKLELSRLGIVDNEGNGVGIPYMQAVFHPYKEGKIIKPGKTYVVKRNLKEYFSVVDDKWNQIKNSKKDFRIICTVQYKGNSYIYSDLILKIN